jgi:hypothetical protein
MKILENFIQDYFCETIHALLEFTSEISFNVCLITGMLALILYVFGLEKGKKWATLSPAIYLLIKIISSLVFGI